MTGQSCIGKLKPASYIVLCDRGTLPPPTKKIPIKPFQIGGIQIQNLNFNCACDENRHCKMIPYQQVANAWAFSKGSPYFEVINYQLTLLKEAGLFENLMLR